MKSLGRHILAEFTDCDSDILNDPAIVTNEMLIAAEKSGANIVNSSFHQFSPYGVSGVVVIKESHFAIHTWPEYRYAAVDLFTCGQSIDPEPALEHLKGIFKGQCSAQEILRGRLDAVERIEYAPRMQAKPL